MNYPAFYSTSSLVRDIKMLPKWIMYGYVEGRPAEVFAIDHVLGRIEVRMLC
jgi:hypothetical protein